MKITIDTATDSLEDIRKVVSLLHELLSKNSSPSYSPPLDTAPMMNMFDDNTSPSVPSSSMAATDKAPDFSSFLSLTKNYEKKDEKPRLEYF